MTAEDNIRSVIKNDGFFRRNQTIIGGVIMFIFVHTTWYNIMQTYVPRKDRPSFLEPLGKYFPGFAKEEPAKK